MNKKNLEIISSIGSVILLIVLFALSHQFAGSSGQSHLQEYGFVGSLVIFILAVSFMGIKLNEME